MRILLNTKRYDAGSRVCIYDLHSRLRAAGVDAYLNDWNDYSSYDIVIFMGYDHELQRARQENPNIKVVLADPKLTTTKNIDSARSADLLLVSSIEQRDSFLRLNQNTMIYYMFPDLQIKQRLHKQSELLIVAYHGNRVHLDALRCEIGPALIALSKKCEIQFHCIYNIETLGCADLSYLVDAGVKVIHRQWRYDALVEMLSVADIGVMPNELPIKEKLLALANTALPDGNLAYEPFDHLVRYKISTNPGRLYPFACAGVPVIADFCPSASQFIKDGESGFIASGSAAWYYAMSRLAESAELRQSCAMKLINNVSNEYKSQVSNFIESCNRLGDKIPSELDAYFEVKLEQQQFNKYPRPQENGIRYLRRQLRHILGY